jgi:rhodanese-related sulfurtransferase
MQKMWQWLSILAILSLLTACGTETLPYKNIDNVTLQQMLDQKTTLIDIRRVEEWQQTGIVKDSHTLTFFFKNGKTNPDFVSQFQTLVTQKDQAVILICRTGNRSGAASKFLVNSLGYTQVYNVKHGITGWIADKRAVETYKN